MSSKVSYIVLVSFPSLVDKCKNNRKERNKILKTESKYYLTKNPSVKTGIFQLQRLTFVNCCSLKLPTAAVDNIQLLRLESVNRCG